MDNRIVIGHRWVGGIGSKTCNLCREMIGKEFYINPKPGQLRYPDDIRVKPPIHPNCRCKLEPITDYLAVVEKEKNDQPPSEQNPHLNDGFDLVGGIWCNDGRSFMDGPAKWNYCGKNWTAGRNPNNVKPGEDPKPFPEPANDLDAKCKDHDECYERAAALKDPKEARIWCDKILVMEAIRLPSDPMKWKKPPSNVDEAKTIKNYVMFYFATKVGFNDLEKRYGEHFMKSRYYRLYQYFNDE